MKNLNKVRTKEQHRVGRIIFFKDSRIAEKFIAVYSDLFAHGCDEVRWDSSGIYVHGTINKEKFDNIVESLGLLEGNFRGNTWKKRYWRFEG